MHADCAGASSLLEDLTPAQVEAVATRASPLCVLAAAGAGKTRVLTRRIAYRVMTGSASARHVLALTFTRKAAAELRSRLRQLGLEEAVTAGTFHSVAAAQLRRWWADRGQPAPAILERKVRLLAALAADRPGLAGVAPTELAGPIEWARARLVGPEDFVGAAAAERLRLPAPAEQIASLYARYENEKRRRGLADFDDLLARLAGAIEADPDFAAAQRWMWRHLFVDEFQDLNPLQHRLLMAWLGDSTDLCVVGDPQQAIYGWNGADPSLLDSLPERYPGTLVVRLDHNHRCTPEIVDAAAAVLGETGGHLRSTRRPGRPAEISAYPSCSAEATGIASQVLAAKAAGRCWSEMAVLARTNAQLLPIQSALAAAGVPVRVAPGRGLRDELAAEVEQPGEVPSGGGAGVASLPRPETIAPQDPSTPEAVTLCTFHRAKGLEWAEVWVSGLEEGLVPMGRSVGTPAEAEERRLLYVALTRAGDILHCSWAKRRRFGEREVPRAPSPWLCAIAGSRTGPSDEAPEHGLEYWRQRLAEQRRWLREGRPRAAVPDAEADPALVDALRAWRSAAARASGVPAHVLLHDRTLLWLAAKRPRSVEELLAVPGFGPVKARRLGPALIEVLAAGGTGTSDARGVG